MKYILLFLSALLLCSCESDNPKLASFNKMERRVNARITKNLPLTLEGSGGAMMDEIKIVSFDYLCHEEMNIEQVRNLLLKVIKITLEEINQDEEIRPYLVQHPFEAKNLDMLIGFRDKNYNSIEPPFIAFAFSKNGTLYYRENQDEFTYRPVLKETYEEALECNAEYESTLKATEM